MQANEVTKLLGINRDRIKYFRKQGVFEPEHMPIGNKSPEYTQTDIDNLKTLIILTKAGLSCGDIKKIQNYEWTIDDALLARRQSIQEEIQRMQGSLLLTSELLDGKVEYSKIDTEYYWNLVLQKESAGINFVDVEAMYGIEAAEHITGMNQSQMKLYVDDGLIHPVKAAKAHAIQNAYTENEMEQMKAVAYLRRYLGIQEIKRFQAYPEKTDKLLLEMSEKNGVYLNDNEEVITAIKKLQALIRDASDMEQIRKETKQTTVPKFIKIILGLGILVFIGWDLIIGSIFEKGILIRVMMGASVIFALISSVMSFRYGTALRRGANALYHGIGTVLRVKEEAGFPAAYSRVGNDGSSFSEQGRGGLWVFFFLFWYELRPDRWYPIIRFEDENGVQAISTFCYGGMKNDWSEGDQIEMAWNNYQKDGLLPCSGNWMKRKALIYAVTSFVLLSIALWMWGVI